MTRHQLLKSVCFRCFYAKPLKEPVLESVLPDVNAYHYRRFQIITTAMLIKIIPKHSDTFA